MENPQSKWMFLAGKSSINGLFSMAMLNNQMIYIYIHRVPLGNRMTWTRWLLMANFRCAKRHLSIPWENWFMHWLVVWNMNFIFPYIGNFIIPTDFHIFQRRWFYILGFNGDFIGIYGDFDGDFSMKTGDVNMFQWWILWMNDIFFTDFNALLIRYL